MTITSNAPRIGRRHLFRAAGAGVAGLTLAACGRDGSGAAPAPPAGGFPVTVEGAEGPTTIDAPPARVVSVGQYRDTDAALALGVVPLAGPDLAPQVPGGVSPWVREALGPRPAPELLATRDGLPFERIAALRPDLILATDRSALANDYPTLSGIAPTLSSASGYNRDTWQVTTTRVGTALGRSAQAAEIVARVGGQVRRPASRTPVSRAARSRSARCRPTASSTRSTATPTRRSVSSPSSACGSRRRWAGCRRATSPAARWSVPNSST